MIDRISSYNSPAFTGMSVDSIKNFIPGISTEAAGSLSRRLAGIIPTDELTTMIRGSNYISHSVKCGDTSYEIGTINYKGKEDVMQKIEYLQNVAEEIKKGTLYV